MARLAGKNCIVTGAAGGIGLETSILFAQNGANVLMSDINADTLNKAVAKVRQFGKDVKIEAFVSPLPVGYGMRRSNHRLTTYLPVIQQCDVSKEDQVQKMVEHLDSWGGLDVIFNNAGIMHADVSEPGRLPDNSKLYINDVCRMRMPSIPRKRSGILLITSMLKVFGTAASMLCFLSAVIAKRRLPSSTPPPSWLSSDLLPLSLPTLLQRVRFWP